MATATTPPSSTFSARGRCPPRSSSTAGGSWPTRPSPLNLRPTRSFELESHGVRHVPLGDRQRGPWNRRDRVGGEAYDEVVAANDWFAATLGRTPWFFRSGTAHYDEVAVAISRSVGQAVAGFSVNADAGATYTATQVAGELARVRPGDIVISHMNRPGRGTSGGMPRRCRRCSTAACVSCACATGSD